MNQNDLDQKSLTDFINENHNLLSALAVLTAIATFVGGISINWLGVILSFLAIAGMVIVWSELNSNFPKNASLKLSGFRYVLLWGLIGLIFYWLLEYREIWNIFLFIPLFALLMREFIKSLREYKEMPLVIKVLGIGKKKNLVQKIIRGLYTLFLLCMIISLFMFSVVLSPAINALLDIIKASSI